MTEPREILPGRTWSVTRHCTQQQSFLRPNVTTKEIFNYCLAEAAEKFGIELLSWIAMSDHYNLVLKDPRGLLPNFMHRLNLHLAKCLNAQLDREENVWSSHPPCVTRLVTEDDVFDKVVEALASPVESNLVASARGWPGASSVKQMDGTPSEPKRPALFFRERGEMPAKVRLRTTPTCLQNENANLWTARVAAALRKREDDAKLARIATGKPVAAFAALVSMSPFDKPKTRERGAKTRPPIACKDIWERTLAIAGLDDFRFAYRVARDAYVKGELNVVFPAGTWLLRSFGVNTAPFPAPA